MTTINKAAFGKRLKQSRNERQLTSDKLSEMAMMNAVFVRQIESGSRLPSLSKLVDLCCALQVSPSYLLGEDLRFENDDELEKLISKLRTLSPKQLETVCSTVNALIEHICNETMRFRQELRQTKKQD